MNKRVIVTFLTIAAVLSICKNPVFAFGMPNMNLPVSLPANPLTSNASNYQGQIGAVNASVDQANIYMDNSIFALSNILLTKDQIQKLNLNKEAILAKTNDKERQAALNKVTTDYMAALQTSIQTDSIKNTVSQLNAKQKELYSNAVYNVGLAGLNYTGASLQATQIVQGVCANPMTAAGLAFQLGQLKALATSLPQQAKTAATLANSLVKIGTANKIMVSLPTSKTDLPKKVDNF